jgi:DNA-binding Xre family transcriptional regulator
MGMIRETIKEAMRIRKVKSKELAEHIELSESSMSLFLNGKMNLGQNKIEAILRCLNIGLVIKK